MTRKTRRLGVRQAAIACALAGMALTLSVPADAQFWGGGWGQPQQAPSRGIFPFPFFERPPPGATAPAESYRAPPPHKPETQPAKQVLVIGDSMADWLGYGLEEVYADSADTGIVRKVKPTFGLIRSEPHSETPEWIQFVRDSLATDTPSAIVVMLGLNDRLPMRDTSPARPAGKPGQPATQPPAAQPPPQAQDSKPAAPPSLDTAEGGEPPSDVQRPVPGASYEFHTDQWAMLYQKRVGELIAALKAKGVPVLWVGLPAIRGPRATADMSYLNDIYRAAAEKNGIDFVNIWDGFVDENGHYSVEGPDFEGQTRRLRTGDGIHFTKFGALKLAHLVDQDLSRVLSNHVAPVAVPTPEAAVPAKPGLARPAIGPVLPLTASVGGGGTGNTLAGGGAAAPVSGDPLAQRVLVRGEAVTAPAGRADNFSWPPGSTAATPQATAAPATPPAATATPH